MVRGKVTKLMDFGAFVEVEAGVEGLVHLSQLSPEHVTRVGDAVKVGEEIVVRVLSVDPARERLSLSRLDPRGVLLGTEEAVDASEIDTMMRGTQDAPRGTNLGALFRKAFEKNVGLTLVPAEREVDVLVVGAIKSPPLPSEN